jgi:hypothetical protein
MPEENDDNLTEAQKQLYRKKKVPHKFCPYCGHKNEAEADRCVNCGKDISWMKVPESVPYDEPPKQKPRSMPDQAQPVFTWKAILVFLLILILVAAIILIIYFTTKGSPMTQSLSVPAPKMVALHHASAVRAMLALIVGPG